MMFWTLFAAALIGAVGNRVRGGLFRLPGTQTGRVVGWAIPCAAVALIAGAAWWVALLIGLGAWIGCTVGQFDTLSLGHRGGVGGWRAWAIMTGWGAARVALPVAVIAWQAGPWRALPLAAAGLVCAPVYDLVWHIPGRLFPPGFGRGDGAATGYDPPEAAEAIHGALLMLALALAFNGGA